MSSDLERAAKQAHAVRMRIFQAIDADSVAAIKTHMAFCRALHIELEAMIQRAIDYNRAKALAFLLHCAAKQPLFIWDHFTNYPRYANGSECLAVLLEFVAEYIPLEVREASIVRFDCSVFVNKLSAISLSHGDTRTYPELARCAAICLAYANDLFYNKPDLLRKRIEDYAQTVLDASPYNPKTLVAAKLDALASITSEPLTMWAAFRRMRKRATDICIGLQDLGLPALCTVEILEAACYPAYAAPKLHDVWRLVTAVKHFERET